jgi:hypothetical protein
MTSSYHRLAMKRNAISIAPGQILNVPLAITPISKPVIDSQDREADDADDEVKRESRPDRSLILIPCNKKSLFSLVVKMSKGESFKVSSIMTSLFDSCEIESCS